MATITEYLFKISPTRFLRGYGPAWLRAVGRLWDAGLDGTTAAVQCGTLASCPVDALEHLGHDRLLPRGSFESDEQYRARLLSAWDAWAGHGTYQSMLDQLALVVPSFVTPHIIEYSWYFIVHFHDSVGDWTPDADLLRRVVDRWRPAHIICHSIIYSRLSRPLLWDGSGTWGGWNSYAWSDPLITRYIWSSTHAI